MSNGRRMALTLAGLTVPLAIVSAQPNPYKTIEGWAKVPEGRRREIHQRRGRRKRRQDPSGSPNAVAPTRVSTDPPSILILFDATGKLVRSFGGRHDRSPHGIHVDRDGNVWMTDGQDNKPRARAARRLTRRCRRRRPS